MTEIASHLTAPDIQIADAVPIDNGPQALTSAEDRPILPIAFDLSWGKELRRQGKTSIDVDYDLLSNHLEDRSWSDEAIKEHLVVVSPLTRAQRLFGSSKGSYWHEGKGEDKTPLVEVFGSQEGGV